MQKVNDTSTDRLIRFSYTEGGGLGLFMIVFNEPAHAHHIGKAISDPTDRIEIMCEGRLPDGSSFFRISVLTTAKNGGKVSYEARPMGKQVYVYRRAAVFSKLFKKPGSRGQGLERPFMFGRTDAVELTTLQVAEAGVDMNTVSDADFFISVPMVNMPAPKPRPKEVARQGRKRKPESLENVAAGEFHMNTADLLTEAGFKWLVEQLNAAMQHNLNLGIAGTEAERVGKETMLRGTLSAVRRPVTWSKL
jgi:hypothetical protein